MTPRIRTILLFLMAAGFCWPRAALAQRDDTNCDWQAVEQHAAGMRTAQQAAMKISEDEGYTEVPPEAIKQIQAFKNELAAALQGYFRCQPVSVQDPGAIEKDLYRRLGFSEPRNEGDASGHGPDDDGPWTGLYLANVTFRVQAVTDTRKLLAVLTTFGIPYGSDAELDVFNAGTKDAPGRRPTVSFTSTPYNSIAGALSRFDYKISPSDAVGNWFVVMTHINPWPTSCWQSLYIDAVRPDNLGMLYQLFHDEEWGYVCDDLPPYLRSISSDGFQVVFAINSVDEGKLSTPSVMTYSVHGEEVTRVQPVALDAINFADEWVRRPWLNAQEWSALENLPRLRTLHDRLHLGLWGDFGREQRCRPGSQFQVEFDPMDSKDVNKDLPPWFFVVKKSGKAYTMLRVSHTADPQCSQLKDGDPGSIAIPAPQR
jgi:hypothetical protein